MTVLAGIASTRSSVMDLGGTAEGTLSAGWGVTATLWMWPPEWVTTAKISDCCQHDLVLVRGSGKAGGNVVHQGDLCLLSVSVCCQT